MMIGLRYVGLFVALVPLAAGCGGDGGKYAGTWKRDLYGEGEVHMKLASNGGVELMLPSPRWPDSVDMKGRGRFKATPWCSRRTRRRAPARPMMPGM